MTFFKYKQKVYTHAYIIFGYTQSVHVHVTSSRRSSISMEKMQEEKNERFKVNYIFAIIYFSRV